jgi:hypothetical protein
MKEEKEPKQDPQEINDDYELERALRELEDEQRELD